MFPPVPISGPLNVKLKLFPVIAVVDLFNVNVPALIPIIESEAKVINPP